MNQKFYALSEEKKQRIITSGYRIFRENSYRKCPVGEIAREAGISKSLLFFYFRNKKRQIDRRKEKEWRKRLKYRD